MTNLDNKNNELFNNFFNIGININKFDTFINDVEKRILNNEILPRKWLNHRWQNILDLIINKDLFLNNNNNKSSKLVKLYIATHSKNVVCNDWVYWHSIIEGVIQNFHFRTSTVSQLIIINDVNKNISKELFGEFTPNWSSPSSIAIKTVNGSIYFLAPLQKIYKEFEDNAIQKMKLLNDIITY